MVGGYKKGLWTKEEDKILLDYIRVHGKGRWSRISKATGLKRCGKSCRLRWINYLSPNVKRDDFSQEEDDLIIRLHNLLGNRWSLIAGRVPGRTDNQVKNHWNTHLSKKLGIKKGKKEVGATPLTQPREAVETLSVNIDSNSKHLPCGNINGGIIRPQVINLSPAQTVNEPTDAQDFLLSRECSESSFWIFNDDFNLNVPSLMGPLVEEFPSDPIWHGL